MNWLEGIALSIAGSLVAAVIVYIVRDIFQKRDPSTRHLGKAGYYLLIGCIVLITGCLLIYFGSSTKNDMVIYAGIVIMVFSVVMFVVILALISELK